MPRKPLELTDEYPYHITARANNREAFPIQGLVLWSIFKQALSKVHRLYRAETISFVLMPNHFHWILNTPNLNLGIIMNHFMRETSKHIGRSSQRINHIYGGPYKRSLIKTEEYLFHAYKYVYQNPLAAGLCLKAQDYPWSTLNYLTNHKPLGFPLFDQKSALSILIPRSIDKKMAWINSEYSGKQKKAIESALKKPVFHFNTRRNDQAAARELRLEANHLEI